MGPTRNSEVLRSFVQYCHDHPQMRFWQALASWSGAAYILETNFAPQNFGKADGWMKDTFNREGREK